MPKGAIYVGRPSRHGNPFVIGQPHPLNHDRPVQDAAQAIVSAINNVDSTSWISPASLWLITALPQGSRSGGS